MITKAVQTFKRLNFNASFGFSQSRLAMKREREGNLALKIKDALKPSYIKVDDITLGPNACGQMYNITVESDLFKGKSLVQQHQMVTDSISDELKNIHGYNLKTKVPEVKQEEDKKEENKKEEDKKETEEAPTA